MSNKIEIKKTSIEWSQVCDDLKGKLKNLEGELFALDTARASLALAAELTGGDDNEIKRHDQKAESLRSKTERVFLK